jgi:hypothetical protein
LSKIEGPSCCPPYVIPYVFHDEYMLHARIYSGTNGETGNKVGTFVSHWLQYRSRQADLEVPMEKEEITNAYVEVGPWISLHIYPPGCLTRVEIDDADGWFVIVHL